MTFPYQKIRCTLAVVVITTLQMTAAIAKRQTAQPRAALAEMALLNAILTSIPVTDSLHAKIAAVFLEDDPEDDWNYQLDGVLAEARKRIV